jgi:hypothetical protein
VTSPYHCFFGSIILRLCTQLYYALHIRRSSRYARIEARIRVPPSTARRRGTGAEPNDLVKLVHSISLRVPGVKRLWIEIDVSPGPVTASALQRSPTRSNIRHARACRGAARPQSVAEVMNVSWSTFHHRPAQFCRLVFACD